jgi:hypothetical protein
MLRHMGGRGLLACVVAISLGAPACSSEPLTPEPRPGNIGIPFTANCAALGDAERVAKCRVFLENHQKYVLPAIEDVTGASFRDCISEIRLVLFADEAVPEGLGNASLVGDVGVINYNTLLTDSAFAEPNPLDWHEPLHLGYVCIGIPHTYNDNHVSWGTVGAEVLQVVYDRSGHVLGAGETEEFRAYVHDWFAQPEDFGIFLEGGELQGCPGVVTYLLVREYVRPNYAIVVEWLRLVRDDVALAQLDRFTPEADRRLEALTFDLLRPEPRLRTELTPYCPSIAE